MTQISRIKFGVPASAGPARLKAELQTKVLFHHQRALVLLRLGGQTAAQILDDLVLQCFAPMAPAARSGKLFHAGAQSAKMHDARRLPELNAEFVAQSREKEEFQAVGGFAREPAEVGRNGVRRT